MPVARSLASASSLVLMGLLVAGCQPSGPKAEKARALVKVQAVAYADHRPAIVLTGSVRAQRETPLAFQVSGLIKELGADIGDHVEAGQLLARLGAEEQQADVTSAEAALGAADAQLEQVQSTFDRQTSLLQQGLTTRSNFESAETALRTAQSSRDATLARLETAKEALSQTELRASASGIIIGRQVEVGEVVQSGVTVYELAEDGGRDAIFDVPEVVLSPQAAQTPIQLALVSDPANTAMGRVREFSPTIDPNSGTVQVKVGIEGTSGKMALGAPVVGTASPISSRQAILPWSALWEQDGKTAVWTVDANGTVAIKPVEVSFYGTGTIGVSSGLSEGELVVTEGTKLLTPGQVVTFAQGAQ